MAEPLASIQMMRVRFSSPALNYRGGSPLKDLKTRDDLNPEVDVHPDLAHWLKTVKRIDFTSHGFIWIRCSGCKKYYAPCAKDLYEEGEEYFCMAECMKEN